MHSVSHKERQTIAICSNYQKIAHTVTTNGSPGIVAFVLIKAFVNLWDQLAYGNFECAFFNIIKVQNSSKKKKPNILF